MGTCLSTSIQKIQKKFQKKNENYATKTLVRRASKKQVKIDLNSPISPPILSPVQNSDITAQRLLPLNRLATIDKPDGNINIGQNNPLIRKKTVMIMSPNLDNENKFVGGMGDSPIEKKSKDSRNEKKGIKLTRQTIIHKKLSAVNHITEIQRKKFADISKIAKSEEDLRTFISDLGNQVLNIKYLDLDFSFCVELSNNIMKNLIEICMPMKDLIILRLIFNNCENLVLNNDLLKNLTDMLKKLTLGKCCLSFEGCKIQDLSSKALTALSKKLENSNYFINLPTFGKVKRLFEDKLIFYGDSKLTSKNFSDYVEFSLIRILNTMNILEIDCRECEIDLDDDLILGTMRYLCECNVIKFQFNKYGTIKKSLQQKKLKFIIDKDINYEKISNILIFITEINREEIKNIVADFSKITVNVDHELFEKLIKNVLEFSKVDVSLPYYGAIRKNTEKLEFLFWGDVNLNEERFRALYKIFRALNLLYFNHVTINTVNCNVVFDANMVLEIFEIAMQRPEVFVQILHYGRTTKSTENNKMSFWVDPALTLENFDKIWKRALESELTLFMDLIIDCECFTQMKDYHELEFRQDSQIYFKESCLHALMDCIEKVTNKIANDDNNEKHIKKDVLENILQNFYKKVYANYEKKFKECVNSDLNNSETGVKENPEDIIKATYGQQFIEDCEKLYNEAKEIHANWRKKIFSLLPESKHSKFILPGYGCIEYYEIEDQDEKIGFSITVPHGTIHQGIIKCIAEEITQILPENTIKLCIGFTNNCPNSATELATLLEFLQTLQHIRYVELNFEGLNIFNEKLFELLVNYLSSLSETLEKLTLNFSRCETITDDDLCMLAENIVKPRRIKKLSLDFSHSYKISDKTLFYVAQIVESFDSLDSLSLNFEECLNISYAGRIELFEKIEKMKLIQLDLNFEKCKRMQKLTASRLNDTLRNLEQLRELQIDYLIDESDFINEEKITKFGEALEKLTKLEKLKLDLQGESEIKDHGLISIFQAFLKFPKLESLELYLKDSVSVTNLSILFLARSITELKNLKIFKINLTNCSKLNKNELHTITKENDDLISKLNNKAYKVNWNTRNQAIDLKHASRAFADAQMNCLNVLNESLVELSDIKHVHMELRKLEELISDDFILSLKASFARLYSMHIFSLDLKNHKGITDEKVADFLEIFGNLPNMRSLKLNFGNCSNIGNQALKSLGEALKANQNLEEIMFNFENCQLTDESISIFHKSIKSNPNLKVIDLDYYNCSEITDASLIYLAKSLKHTLNLEKFKLGCDRCDKLTDNGFIEFSDSCSYMLQLKDIYMFFAANYLTSSTIRKLYQSMHSWIKLESFQLHLVNAQGIKDNSLVKISTVLGNMPKIHTLVLDFYSSGKFTDKGINSLCQNLMKAEQLKHLSLYFYNSRSLVDEYVSNLIHSLKNLSNLFTLTLNLSFCDNLTAKSIKPLQESLPKMQNLRAFTFDLYNCENLGDNLLIILIDCINKMPNFNKLVLDIRGCDLKQNAKLKFLEDIREIKLENQYFQDKIFLNL